MSNRSCPFVRVAALAAALCASVSWGRAPQEASPPASVPAPAQATAPAPAASGADVGAWSDELWEAARSGDRERVERLLKSVPEGAGSPAVERVRRMAAAREEHLAATERSVAEERAKREGELADALAKGSAVNGRWSRPRT